MSKVRKLWPTFRMRHEQFYSASGWNINTKLCIQCKCAGSAWIALIFTGRWEGTQAGQLTQTSEKDISYHVTAWSVQNEGLAGGGTRCLGELVVWGESLRSGVLFDFSEIDSIVQSCFEHKVGSGSLQYRIRAHGASLHGSRLGIGFAAWWPIALCTPRFVYSYIVAIAIVYILFFAVLLKSFNFNPWILPFVSRFLFPIPP